MISPPRDRAASIAAGSTARPAAAWGSRPQTAVNSTPSVLASAGACVIRAQYPVPTSPNRSGFVVMRVKVMRSPAAQSGSACIIGCHQRTVTASRPLTTLASSSVASLVAAAS